MKSSGIRADVGPGFSEGPVGLIDGQLHLYGIVGTMGGDFASLMGLVKSFSAHDVVASLAKHGSVKDITVRLNSAGGDAYEGIAIYNALKNHKGKVTVMVDAIAGSAASIIAMAGNPTVMAKGSILMLHEPFGATEGTADDHMKSAEAINVMGDAMAEIYASKTGESPEKMRQAMKEETWLLGKAAVDAGFADTYEDSSKIKALIPFRYDLYSRAPKALLVLASSKGWLKAPKAEVTVNAEGLSQAKSLIAGGSLDGSSDWAISADDENAMLGQSGDDLANYGKMHLGVDPSAADNTKEHFKYPFGKDGKVYRSALVAIRQRAGQEGADAIAAAAGSLLESMDSGNEGDDEMTEEEKKTLVDEAIKAANERSSKILAACTAAKVPQMAAALISSPMNLAECEARIKAAGEIRAKCESAQKMCASLDPKLADHYIEAGASPEFVGNDLLARIAAANNMPPISGNLGADGGGNGKAKIDISAIYTGRRKARAERMRALTT